MCRLLGYVADRPTAVVDVLGEDGLDTFTSLTAVHGDGWGIAWQDPDDRVARCVSSPDSAAYDPTYVEVVRRPLGPAGLVHLRWATGGLPVTQANTHPFIDGGYAFAHNGHVSPIDKLESLLSPRTGDMLVGDTDSERYFRLVMQSIAECEDEERGVAQALGILIREFPDSSLNSLLLTPSRMFAVHVNSRATSPSKALNEMFESADDIPDRHTTEYFAMDYRVTPDAVHVISSGLGEPGWSPVPPDSAAMIDLETRQVVRFDP
jgi:predicted glutamine amidotransferase